MKRLIAIGPRPHMFANKSEAAVAYSGVFLGIDVFTLTESRTLVFMSTCHVTHYSETEFPNLRSSLYGLVRAAVIDPTKKNKGPNTIVLEGIAGLNVVKDEGLFTCVSAEHLPLPVFEKVWDRLGEPTGILALAQEMIPNVTITSPEPSVAEEVVFLSKQGWDEDDVLLFYLARNFAVSVTEFRNRNNQLLAVTLDDLIAKVSDRFQLGYIRSVMPTNQSESEIMSRLPNLLGLSLEDFNATYIAIPSAAQKLNALFDPRGEAIFGRMNHDLNQLRDERLFVYLSQATMQPNSMTSCVFGSGHGDTLVPRLTGMFSDDGSLLAHHHSDYCYDSQSGSGFRSIFISSSFSSGSAPPL
jgi:hypothetical protein